GTSELVPNVLGDNRRLDAEPFQASIDLRLQNLAEVDLRDAQVPVRVSFHFTQAFEIFGRYIEDDAFGDDRDAVTAVVAEAFEDRSHQCVHELLEPDRRLGELLGDEGQRGASRLADPECQMPGLPAHGDDEVPARRRFRVDHQVLDDL